MILSPSTVVRSARLAQDREAFSAFVERAGSAFIDGALTSLSQSEAFSDGVFAIIITIMVLDLRPLGPKERGA